MAQKTFIRKIKQGDKIRYAEVWNERRGKKVIQHHVQYLGSDPDHLPPPTSFTIEMVHFGYLAQLILKDVITADDIYTMLEENVSWVGYNFSLVPRAIYEFGVKPPFGG